jgi:ubiquinone/menaquinone biosynthesis C-methylase UbiE
MHSFVHRPVHSSATRGHTLGPPRPYNLVASVAFVGLRRARFLKLIAAAGVKRGQRVLDVGCGTGHLVRLLAEVVGKRDRLSALILRHR